METDKQLLDPKLTQRVFSTKNALIVHYVYEPGLEFEEQSHPQEQITIIQSGHLILEIDGEKVELKSGDICSIAHKNCSIRSWKSSDTKYQYQ